MMNLREDLEQIDKAHKKRLSEELIRNINLYNQGIIVTPKNKNNEPHLKVYKDTKLDTMFYYHGPNNLEERKNIELIIRVEEPKELQISLGPNIITYKKYKALSFGIKYGEPIPQARHFTVEELKKNPKYKTNAYIQGQPKNKKNNLNK